MATMEEGLMSSASHAEAEHTEVVLMHSDLQADAEPTGVVHSEPGAWTRSVLGQRFLAFFGAIMAWSLLACMTVWISAPPSEEDHVCPLQVWKDLGVKASSFFTIIKWTLAVVNLFPAFLAGAAFVTNIFSGSKLACDWYSILMIAVVVALAFSTADLFWSSSFDPKEAMSFRAALRISLLAVQVFYLKYINSTNRTIHPDGENLSKLPRRVWVLLFSSFCILAVRFIAVSVLASDIINSIAPLLSQCLTAAALGVAYRAIHFRMANASPTNDSAFAQKAQLGIAMLIFVNVAQIFDHFLLLLRVLVSTRDKQLVIWFDEEIMLLLSLFNITMPLAFIVMVTPNWKSRGSHHQSMYGNATGFLLRAVPWVLWVIYVHWGVHRTCNPPNVDAASEGGWLYVVAKACAATFYLDVPLLFASVHDGPISLTLKTMGFYISKDEAVAIHRTVATRLVGAASLHSLGHLWWMFISSRFTNYVQDVWHGNTWTVQIPLYTGVVMWLSVLSTVAAYPFKERAYGWFRAAKRMASILFLFFGLFHGSAAALGLPTLWLFALWAIVYYALDAVLHRFLFYDTEVEFQMIEGDHRQEEQACIMCLSLPPQNGFWGHLLLQVFGVDGWNPFTVAHRGGGGKEVHILAKPRVEDHVAGQYANWSSQLKARAVSALRYENPLRIRWSGPFGGKLSNSDLYSMVDGVILVCWGTGFTTITQGLSSLLELMRSRGEVPPVHVFWRGSGPGCDELYREYYYQKVVPICAEYELEYPVENVLQTWIQSQGAFRVWNRNEFKKQVIAKVRWYTENGGTHGGKVFVGMCGGSPAVTDMEEGIDLNLGDDGRIQLVTKEKEVFGK